MTFWNRKGVLSGPHTGISLGGDTVIQHEAVVGETAGCRINNSRREKENQSRRTW